MTSLRLTVLLLLAATAAAQAAPKENWAVPTKRPPDRERGRELYLRSCWQCHGEEGKGDGPAADALPGGVPSLEGKVKPEVYDDLVKVVLDGKGRMPAFREDIDKHDARRIFVYVQDALQGRTELKKPKEDDEAEEPAGN